MGHGAFFPTLAKARTYEGGVSGSLGHRDYPCLKSETWGTRNPVLLLPAEGFHGLYACGTLRGDSSGEHCYSGEH
jgi:hypothetical protein